MIEKRQANNRGATRLPWLESKHTFSFGRYYDPEQMGFRRLRVINDDRVAPGRGFGTHPHDNMEIISYVVEGALEHEDSMGNGSVIRAGDVQLMSAGTGVRHSEYNASQEEPVRFLQIWIPPERRGLEPSYQQRSFDPDERRGKLRLLVSPDGRDGSLRIHQDAYLYGAALEQGDAVTYEPGEARYVWVQVVRGEVELNGVTLAEGDGAAVADEEALALQALGEAEVLVFDLA